MMVIRRAVPAHLVAVLFGSLLLMIRLEIVIFGPLGVLSGIGKWIGGVLVFLAISIVSIPAGLGLRWSLGKLPMKPVKAAIIGGSIVGVGLLFTLHPAMYPPMSFATHPLSLVVVHVGAGVLAGWMWYLTEFKAWGRQFD